MKGNNMAQDVDDRVRAESVETISSQLFRSDAAPSTIKTVIVTDDRGTRYTFGIDMTFFSLRDPAFILTNITPEPNADLLYDVQHSKFWVYGGELTVGHTMLLRQAAQTQRFLTERIPVASSTVRHIPSAST